jgi:hypothetical protein
LKNPTTFLGQIALANLVTELMQKDDKALVKEAPPLIPETETEDPFAEADAVKEVIPEVSSTTIVKRKRGEDATGFYHL